MQKPFTQLGQLHNLVRQFTPNWFTVTMGTGVVALIISEFPFLTSFTWQLGTGLWLFNILLFVFFVTLYSLRWIFFPHEAKQIIQHPMMSLFLGAIPMALATIINGFLKYGLPIWGDISIQIAAFLWVFDVILAVLIAWFVPFLMYQRQRHDLNTMTAVWLLPIVACEVAASSGGLLIGHLVNQTHQVAILMTSYTLWGISVLPAFAILTILMLRLGLHQLPGKDLAISCWLALGPIGTGALALLLLGAQAPHVMGTIGLGQIGVTLHDVGILGSLILIGFGLWWLGIAVLTTLHYLLQDLPFNLGWWGLTFPLGVFTLAILNLAQQIGLNWMYDIGYGFAVVLMLLWCLVIAKTAQGFYRGNLFFSPCLKIYLENKRSI